MARPTTKDELLRAGEDNFKKMFALIDSMSSEQQEQTFLFEDRDRNIRDVLIHLYEWHGLLLRWVHDKTAGGNAPFLPEPYSWKTYPAMNVALWEKHQATSLEQAKEVLRATHAEVMALAGTFTDEELFTKKHFPWTGTTSLGAYFISSAPSHYDWAMKKIKQHRKSLNDRL